MGNTLRFLLLIVLTLALFMLSLFVGGIHIPVSSVLDIIAGGDGGNGIWEIVIEESRLPMAWTALIAGAGLGVSGLLMQTTFQNPLAGPSVLGVSSGASLGVAVVMLAAGSSFEGLGSTFSDLGSLVGAVAGSGTILLILLAFSSLVKSSLMLLIIGMMISYLTSSVISILNFFAPAEGIKSFVLWGMGSYSGTTLDQIPLFGLLVGVSLLLSFLMVKPLNALLMGERYAENMGYSIRRTRSYLMLLSGFLTAIVTSYCGPIGFMGLIVPHMARMFFRTSNHLMVVPATLLSGCVISLFCSIMSVLPSGHGVIPINVITPVIGVPFIIYLILNRKRLRFFN